MSPEWIQKVESLFQAALERNAAGRAAYLATACAGDAALRQEVESLLAAYEDSSGFMETSAADVVRSRLPAPTAAPPPAGRIGPYRVVREIGRGGMGAVYLAERDDAFHKQVAIKQIKKGMDSEAIIQRFRHERQILATLEHPNIARLLDGGTTAEGLPYFVMEYVEGLPLHEYCEQNHLSVPRRLELFGAVCAAVAYAHQGLVVHRDIKPSNILVCADGQPKLLDFGIAKLLHPGSSAQTAESLMAARPMTPEYASPEQVRGERVTTASDVYSLGVLLYELLTGRRPYSFQDHSRREIEEWVCEKEPPPPSAASPAARLGPDLDAIVRMAMRKEPARRYASVRDLAGDIGRYLEGQPVLARPDTLAYRTAKFVRRHQWGVGAAALLLVTLLAGITATLWQLREARAQRARAEQRLQDVRQLADAFIFKLHDQVQRSAESTPLRKEMVSIALPYLNKLAQDAGDDPVLLRELATAYERLGDVQGQPNQANIGDLVGGLESYRKAVALRERLAAADPRDMGVRRDLAQTYMRIGDRMDMRDDIKDMLESYRRAQVLCEAVAGAEPDHAKAHQHLGVSYRLVGEALARFGRAADSLESYRRAVAALERANQLDGLDPELQQERAAGYRSYAQALAVAGDRVRALEAGRKALEVTEQLAALPPDPWLSANAAMQLALTGGTWLALGDRERCLQLQARARNVLDTLARQPSVDLKTRSRMGTAYSRIARSLYRAEMTEAAIACYRQALVMREAVLAVDPQNFSERTARAVIYNDLAATLLGVGDLEGARENFLKRIDWAASPVTDQV